MHYTLLPDSVPSLLYQDKAKTRRFRSATREAFQNAAAPSPDDFATSAKRLAGLRALFVGKRQVPLKYVRMVDALERAFRMLVRHNQREEFAPEDLAAPDSLA
jgi:hypothetical protein